jgi:DNA-binding transcriptional MerR regulator
METYERDAALERAENILNQETPHNAREGYIYSELARAAFGKIKLFRSKGFSYAQICAALEKAGMLPKNSNPYSLRQAFKREQRRLKREEELMELLKGNKSAEVEAMPAQAEKSASVVHQKAPKFETEASKPDDKVAERERIKKMTGVPVNTGTSTIIKYTDGSFDF